MTGRWDAANSTGFGGPHPVSYFERIRSAELRELYFYWGALRHGRAMPSRYDIDPADITDCLPFVSLLQIELHPVRFRFTYVGAGIATVFRQDMIGHTTDELDLGESGAKDVAMLCDVVAGAQPVHRAGELVRMSGWRMRRECIALPLTKRGPEVDMILMGQRWEAIPALMS